MREARNDGAGARALRPAFGGESLTAADMGDRERAKAAYRAATERREVRAAMPDSLCHALRRDDYQSQGLDRVFHELRALQAAGATAAERQRIAQAVAAYDADLDVGAGRRTLDVLDLEDVRHEAREDLAQMQRRCEGESPTVLELEADACEAAAAVDLERARCLRARAHQLRSGRETARGRLNLAGRA